MSSNPTILKVATPAGDEPLIAGGARFWRTNFALFLGSFATFAMLYCVHRLFAKAPKSPKTFAFPGFSARFHALYDFAG